MEMPGREMDGAKYRFGFNGKEKDENGEFGSQTTYDYGFRIYNPSIARFLSVDPLFKGYPFYTPVTVVFHPIKPIELILCTTFQLLFCSTSHL